MEHFIETDLKNILPLKKLDETLQFLLDVDKPPFRTFDEIQKNINFDAQTKDLEELLDKLEEDGYVKSEIRDSDKIKVYRSTFNGRFFKAETGGYLESIQHQYRKRQSLIVEKKRLENLEHFQKANANRMTCLTIILAAGATVAAIYYLNELYGKWFH